MSKAIAIGGGSWQLQETLRIDQEIIALTNKVHPKVLFFPTASKDDQGYAKRFKQYYRSLGCEVTAIRLLHTKKSREEVSALLLAQDILYFGGGDTPLLLKTLCEWGLEEVIRQAYQQDIILVGFSAGANMLFEYGYSDLQTQFAFVKGLGILTGVFTPHAQLRENFLKEASCFPGEKIACDDGTAYFYIEGNGYFMEASSSN